MFTARITRKVRGRVVKSEMSKEGLHNLLDLIMTVYPSHQILEIHIVREK